MTRRMLAAWALVIIGLCPAGLTAARGTSSGPRVWWDGRYHRWGDYWWDSFSNRWRPPEELRPRAQHWPGSGWHTCRKCDGTGYRWDKKCRRWVRCKTCDGRGYVHERTAAWWESQGFDPKDCFVATAAYGAPWEANVAKLRRFRDECLLHSPVGRGFVSLYYAVSPPLARWIAERPWARAATRAALTPVVTVAGALMGDLGDIGTLAGVMGIGWLVVWRRKRARRARAKARVRSRAFWRRAPCAWAASRRGPCTNHAVTAWREGLRVHGALRSGTEQAKTGGPPVWQLRGYCWRGLWRPGCGSGHLARLGSDSRALRRSRYRDGRLDRERYPAGATLAEGMPQGKE